MVGSAAHKMEKLSNFTYLDYNATTPVHPIVQDQILNWVQVFGNPSSIHGASRGSRTLIRESRNSIARWLGIRAQEIIFNSGASEGNNTILNSVWKKRGAVKPEFLISSVEHPSVINTAKAIQSEGATIQWIPVSRSGELDLAFIANKMSEKTALISVMAANNETGVIHPISDIVKLAKEKKVLVHSDCVQMLGKANFNFLELGLDYATFSAHKFYALKGSGFVYVKHGSPYQPLIFGGSQERARRGGTENSLGIAAMGLMADYFTTYDLKNQMDRITGLRDHFEYSILSNLDGIKITAGSQTRLGNTSHMMIEGVDAETLLINLDLLGFCVSTGAACSSGSPEPSPVLLSMGFSKAEAQTSLRVSLGLQTTSDQMRLLSETLINVVKRLRLLNEKFKGTMHV